MFVAISLTILLIHPPPFLLICTGLVPTSTYKTAKKGGGWVPKTRLKMTADD